MKLSQKFLGLLTLVTIFSANSFACIDFPVVIDENIHLTARGLKVKNSQGGNELSVIISTKTKPPKLVGAFHQGGYKYNYFLTREDEIVKIKNPLTGKEVSKTVSTFKNTLKKRLGSGIEGANVAMARPITLVEVFDPTAPIPRSMPGPNVRGEFNRTYTKSGCSWNWE